MTLLTVAALLCALVPGVAAWWSGRQLLARRDDAALPELLWHRRSRLTSVAALAFALIVFVARGALLPVAIALFVVALFVGSYPARRALRGETWSLGAYLRSSLGRVVASAGFFIGLALAPQIVLAVPPGAAPWVAGALALILVVWARFVVPFWLRVHGATPIADHPVGAGLVPRFAAIVAASRARPPETYRIGRPGERLVGAFALPSSGSRPAAVAFGDSLLELLTPDEVVAVFAHEVAHLEHFTPARVRRGFIASVFLAVAAVTLPLAVRAAQPASAWLVTIAWPLVVLLALALRAGRSKANELASDRRAAELCGDPEAMIRALVTLHTALQLPRRWSADAERAATHPSLANRIRALRAAAAATGSLGEPVVLRSTKPGTFVVLDAARVSVLAGVPDGTPLDAAALRDHAGSIRADAYEQLVELRVSAERGARTLVATDRAGATWRVPLEPADVRAAQAALDVVDVRLAPRPAAGRATTTTTRSLAVLVPVSLFVAAMVTGHFWLVFLAALLALLRAGPATMALLGATALGSALTALAWDATTASVVLPSRVVALGVLVTALGGAVALALAWRDARANATGGDGGGRGATVAVVASALMAVLLGGAALFLWRATPSAALPVLRNLAIALAGLGAALATLPDRRRRWLGGLALAAALVAALLPLRLHDAVGRGGARPIALGTAAAVEVARVVVDAPARDLRLSPSGARFAVRELARLEDDTADVEPSEDALDDDALDEAIARSRAARARDLAAARFVVGTFGDSAPVRTTRGDSAADRGRRRIAASDLAFVDDDHVLALASRERGDSLALTLEPVVAVAAGAAPIWETRLSPLDDARLRYSAAADGARRWTVVGRDRRTRDLVAISGLIGAAGDVTTHRWRAGADSARGGRSVVGSLYLPGGIVPTADGGAVAIHFDNGAPTAWWPLMAMLGAPTWSWGVWRFAGDAPPARVLTTGGLLRCAAPHADAPPAAGASSAAAACVVQDRDVATVWLVPPVGGGGAPRALGRVDGWYGQPVAGPDGGVALPAMDGRTVVLVDARAGRGARVAWPDVPRRVAPRAAIVQELEWTPGGLARLVSDARRRSEVVLYRVR